MYTVVRTFFPNGIEGESTDSTYKDFETLEKAFKYAERYAKGIRFCDYRICDNEMNDIYTKNYYGQVEDFR